MSANDAAYLANLNDTSQGPLQRILNDLDKLNSEYVYNVYTQLVNSYEGTLWACGVLYLAVYFAAIMRGMLPLNMGTVSTHLAKFVVIFSLMQWWADWAEQLYLVFTNGPGELIAVIHNASGFKFYGESSINAGTDIMVIKGYRVASILFERGAIMAYFLGGIIFGVTTILAIIAGSFLVATKLVMTALLAVAPIFLIFLLFQNTRGFFEGWFRNVMTFIFIPILLNILLSLALHLMVFPLKDIENAVREDLPGWSWLVGFIIVAGIIFYLISQIKGVASSIGGGFVMTSMTMGGELTRSVAGGITKTYNRWRR